MKHLKLFKTEAEYTQFKESEAYILPNVSFVEEDNKVEYNPESTTSSYVMVDLGLPSGTLWADRNVGAESPEDGGLYFQWGDTVGYTADQVGKDKVFDWTSYWDSVDGTSSNFNKYATDKLRVLEASDDAATVNMGSDWRMPTRAEIQELKNNTTATYIDLQGNEFSQSEAQLDAAIKNGNLKGVRFTGPNGNSIFVPASGAYYDSTLFEAGRNCLLWSTSMASNLSSTAMCFCVTHNGKGPTANYDRKHGLPVRGVCNK